MPITSALEIIDGSANIVGEWGGDEITVGAVSGRRPYSELQLVTLALNTVDVLNNPPDKMRYERDEDVDDVAEWATHAYNATVAGGAWYYGITGAKIRTQTRTGTSTAADIVAYGSAYAKTVWDVRTGSHTGTLVGRLYRAWYATDKLLIDQWVLAPGGVLDTTDEKLYLQKLTTSPTDLSFVDVNATVQHVHEAYVMRPSA